MKRSATPVADEDAHIQAHTQEPRDVDYRWLETIVTGANVGGRGEVWFRYTRK